MPFSFARTAIPDVILIVPPVFADHRGFFMETYKHSEFAAEGITETFVQCNHSKSAKGILRGLHYQKYPRAQGKLVRALAGEIYDVGKQENALCAGWFCAWVLRHQCRR